MATWRAGRTASHGDRGAGRPLRPAPVPARPAAPTTRRRAALSHTGHAVTDMSGFDGEVCVRYEAVYRRAQPACGGRPLFLAGVGGGLPTVLKKAPGAPRAGIKPPRGGAPPPHHGQPPPALSLRANR